MDNPGASIFQGTNININNSRNEEEAEDLEDQKRRNEELQNLLMTKLDDFNYDESTINSSIISAISLDDAQTKYLKAENESEQLKVLYEVRGRELQALREEYKNVTDKMTKQIDVVKKKLTLTEAELEQLKVSYKNSEELLVEKVQTIKELSSVLESKEKQIEEYMKDTENLHIEVATYKSTLEDLHLQIRGDKNPFASSNKHFNSEEMKTVHREQINKLENLLDEKTVHAKQTERENQALKEQLNKLIDANTDNSKLIKTLTKNFEAAQKQCENLIEVVETLSNENNHLQDRVNNTYNSPSKRNSLDFNTLASHVDKLKRMLLDKSVQINTLNAKLKNYEENLKELLEYRKLKSDAYQKEFQQCENEDHIKNLILMQNNLQNYRRIIEDKNQQILNLNSTNKDLLSKMEETLSQTRNDIQTFSTKYSLPQLEKMAEDLKASEKQILELEEKLKCSEEKRLHLSQEDQNKEKIFKEELEALKRVTEKDRNNFENQIKKLQNESETSLNEIKKLKQYIEELANKNDKLQNQLRNMGTEDESLKNQYLESIQALQDAQNKVKNLQETVDELMTLKTTAEGERCTFELQAKDSKSKLEDINKHLSSLEAELDQATKDKQGREEMIMTLQKTISNLTDELNRISQDRKDEKECSFKSSTQTPVIAHKKPESEKKIRRNLDAELKATQELEREKESNLISIELKLREEIQEEYFKKLNDIEGKYQKACDSSKALCKEQVHKLKDQESKFREHLGVILNECSKKIEEFETERENLIKNIDCLQNQLGEYKKHTNCREEQFKKLIDGLQVKNRTEAEKWKLWSQKLINSCLKIEASNKKSRDNILFKMQRYDTNVEAVEKTYEKAKKKLNKKK